MQPNSEEFPDFDDNLRQAFEREASLFFESIVREDRNVLDLMTADYTFLNERLAQHYGIPNVYGSHFRRVTLPDEARHGLLGKGAVLMVTSHTDRTSPVVRGKWVLDNLLSAPVPPMPNNVPPLNEDANRGGKHPDHARAHGRTPEEPGRARRATGSWTPSGSRWRTSTRSAPGARATATASSTRARRSTHRASCSTARKVDGIVTLRQALLRQPELFVGTVTEKLMIYALGRGLQPYDMPSVRAIVRDTAQSNYRFSSIVMGIINSTPFQKRVTLDEPVRFAKGSR